MTHRWIRIPQWPGIRLANVMTHSMILALIITRYG